MKLICFVFLVALATPSCSTFSAQARRDRAYRKYVQRSMATREKRRKQRIEHQRAEIQSLPKTPPTVEQENVQFTTGSENQ